MPADRPFANHQSNEPMGNARARARMTAVAPMSGNRSPPSRTGSAARETPPPTRAMSRRRTLDSPTLIATVRRTRISDSTAAVERSKLDR